MTASTISPDGYTGKVTISTPRLLMRQARSDDSRHLHKAFSNAEVMRFWSTPPHKLEEETEAWVAKMAESPQNGITDFIMCLKRDPEPLPVGKIGVWQGNEIGFLLGREWWGKGLAKEALTAVLEYMFEKRGFEELMADIDPRNEASEGILKKMGFEVYDYKEKTLEIGGEWVDSSYLKLTREEWLRMAADR